MARTVIKANYDGKVFKPIGTSENIPIGEITLIVVPPLRTFKDILKNVKEDSLKLQHKAPDI